MAGGVNDAVIIGGIVAVFCLVGGVLPYINSEFGNASSSVNVGSYVSDLGGKIQSGSSIGMWDVIKSIFLMFFWTFGDLPFFIDLAIFLPMRIVLAFIIARNIWIGGGA